MHHSAQDKLSELKYAEISKGTGEETGQYDGFEETGKELTNTGKAGKKKVFHIILSDGEPNGFSLKSNRPKCKKTADLEDSRFCQEEGPCPAKTGITTTKPRTRTNCEECKCAIEVANRYNNDNFLKITTYTVSVIDENHGTQVNNHEGATPKSAAMNIKVCEVSIAQCWTCIL